MKGFILLIAFILILLGCKSNQDTAKVKLHNSYYQKTDSLIKKGNFYLSNEDSFANSLAIFKEAQNLAKKYNYISGIVTSSYKIGYIYSAQSNVTFASENLYLSLKNAELLKDSSSMAQALAGLGLVMFNMNKWNSALSYFKKASVIHNSQKQEKQAKNLIQYLSGLCYYHLQDYKKANQLLEESKKLAVLEQNEMRIYEIRLYLNHIKLIGGIDKNILLEYDTLLKKFKDKKEKVGAC